jgi:exocyst complex component 2
LPWCCAQSREAPGAAGAKARFSARISLPVRPAAATCCAALFGAQEFSRSRALITSFPARPPAAQEAALLAKRADGSATGGDAAGPSLRARLLPSSEHFDPELYLAVVHGDAQLQDLLRGLGSLRAQLSEHAGQLKSLVKEHFGRFISSKDTIDDVAAKLRAAEAEGGVGVNGATPGEVAAAVARAQEDARRAFGPLLERQARAGRLKAVLGLLDQHDSLVGLPSRVRRQAEAGDYAGVVAEYNAARAVLAGRGGGGGGGGVGGGGGDQSVWARLLGEVDNAVAAVVHTLETVVDSPHAAPGEVFDAMKHLTQLRAAGAPAAAGADPLSAYVAAQERHVGTLLDAQSQRYRSEAATARRQQRQSRGGEADEAAAAAAEGGARAGAELAAVRYVGDATAAVSQWAPRFWDLTQRKAPELLAVGAPADALDAGMAAAERCMQAVLRQYCQSMEAVLGQPSGSSSGAPLPGSGGLGIEGATAAAAELGAGCAELVRLGAPADAVAALRGLVALAGRAGVDQLRTHLVTSAAALAVDDTRQTQASQRLGGQPSGAAVGALRRLAAAGMRRLAEMRAECAAAEVDLLAGPPLCPPHELLCLTFTSYAEAAAASEPAAAGAARRPASASSHPDARLLQLCSDLVAARSEALPRLAGAWAALLSAGAPPAALRDALQACGAAVEGAEDALMGSYIERKQAVLDGIMEEFFFGGVPPAGGPAPAASSEWELAPPPARVRPVALDLLCALAGAQAELAAAAPALATDALCELVSGLLAGLAQVVGEGLPGGPTPGGVCQVWLEVAVLEEAVAGLAARDPGLAAALAGAHAVLESQLQAALGAASEEELGQLAAWCGGGGGASVPACRRRVQEMCALEAAAARGVVHPLRLFAAG